MSDGWDKARDTMLATLGGQRFVGIFHGQREEDDPGYSRVLASFGQDAGSDGTRIFSNLEEVVWPPLRKDTDSDATGWALFDDQGQLTPVVPFERPRRLLRSDNYVARIGELRLAIP